MKKITKLMAIVFAFAMLVSLCIPAFAANSMTISVADKTVKAGEEVTVDVMLENNPGFNYLKLKVEYSPAMTIIAVKDGKLFDYMKPTPGNKNDNPYVYLYASTEDENYNGKLFSITFKVADDAEIKDHFIAISVVQCVNQSNENVSVKTKSGMISVLSNGNNVTTTKPADTSTTTTKPADTSTTTTKPADTSTTTTKPADTSTTTTKPADTNTTTTKPVDTNTTTTEPSTKDKIPQTGESDIVAVVAGVCVIASVAFVATRKKNEE